jgi:hypothetical protein
MRARTDRLKNAADYPLFDELTREHSALGVNSLAVVDHVLPASLRGLGSCLFQLVECRKRGLVGEIVFAAIHHSTTEMTTLTWDGRRRDKLD